MNFTVIKNAGNTNFDNFYPAAVIVSPPWVVRMLCQQTTAMARPPRRPCQIVGSAWKRLMMPPAATAPQSRRLASGASAETQHAIGTGVFGGMLSGTLLAIFFVPAFFVFVIGSQERLSAWLGRRNHSKTAKG